MSKFCDLQAVVNHLHNASNQQKHNSPYSPNKMVDIFLSYANKDIKQREEFEEICLSSLVAEGVVRVWYKDLIPPGTNASLEIGKQLETCQVFIPLISSKYVGCYNRKLEGIDIQVNKALQKSISRSTLIIPIYMTAVSWSNSPFKNLQSLPRNNEPVDSRRWSKRNEALRHITEEIESQINRLFLAINSSSSL